jgi:hypothetical protein
MEEINKLEQGDTSHSVTVNPSERYSVHWPVVIIYKKAGADCTFHGQTFDLSLGGACIYADENIFVEDEVVMSIMVHTINHKRKVIGVKCRMLYNIVSTNYGKFRIGIQFIEFNGNSREVLSQSLASRPIIKNEDMRKKEKREEELRQEEALKEEKELFERATRIRLEEEIRRELEVSIRAKLEAELKQAAAEKEAQEAEKKQHSSRMDD